MVNEPKFDELCRLIGMAILMSQKVQFSLAHYHGFHKMIRAGLSKEDAKREIAKSLSNTLGGVITQIKLEAPLEPVLSGRLDTILKERNWLAHNFDHEATLVIAAGQDFTHFSERMAAISQTANDLMIELDQIGNALAAEVKS